MANIIWHKLVINAAQYQILSASYYMYIVSYTIFHFVRLVVYKTPYLTSEPPSLSNRPSPTPSGTATFSTSFKETKSSPWTISTCS